jgi:hypothetical protein
MMQSDVADFESPHIQETLNQTGATGSDHASSQKFLDEIRQH